MERIAIPVETEELCHYGCGCQAKFRNGSGNLMCLPRSNSCPEKKKKNAKGLSKAHADGKMRTDFGGNNARAWSKGNTKETDLRIGKTWDVLREKIKSGEYIPRKGWTHTEEAKQQMSKKRSAWLSIPGNRKNYGRHKKSWMEMCFEKWLGDNKIEGWESEKHFRNLVENKNYFSDYCFEDKKLIIELDGTQHLKTIEKDKIRDEFLSSLGYKVIRISHKNFKERYFSNVGFRDILGR